MRVAENFLSPSFSCSETSSPTPYNQSSGLKAVGSFPYPAWGYSLISFLFFFCLGTNFQNHALVVSVIGTVNFFKSNSALSLLELLSVTLFCERVTRNLVKLLFTTIGSVSGRMFKMQSTLLLAAKKKEEVFGGCG